MKALFSTLVLVALTTLLTAQDGNPFGTQVGVGFGASNWGIPVYVKFDTPLTDDITIGGKVAYSNRSYTRSILFSNYGYRTSTIAFSARGQYYFDNLINAPEKYDVYAGVGLGFYVRTNNYDNDFDDDFRVDPVGGVGAGLFVGGRLYFSDKVALNAELGGGNQLSGATVGLSFRLN